MKNPHDSDMAHYNAKVAVANTIQKRIDELKKHTNGKNFLVNTKKHYKIWFTDNPDIFLPFINQLRLIRLRESLGENAEIRLVYSGRLLSDQAKKDLNVFCKKHKITAVNFDTIEASKENDDEIKELVHLEIEKAINNQGGDLAAASDMARVMLALAKLGGIYSDCDIVFDKAHCAQLKPKILIDTPVALYCEINEQGNIFSTNSVIVPSTTKGDGKTLTQECINCFKAAQNALLTTAKQPIEQNLLYTVLPENTKREAFANPISSKLLAKVLKEFLKRNPQDQSIHNFRLFIKNFDYRMHLLVMFQDHPQAYQDIEQCTDQAIQEVYHKWIVIPGNLESSGSDHSFPEIIQNGLFYITKNGAKLDGISIRNDNGRQSLGIGKELLIQKSKEHLSDVANIFIRAIRDALYISTVIHITGPDVQCTTMTTEYTKTNQEKAHREFQIEASACKFFHRLESIFPKDSFTNPEITRRFTRVMDSTTSFPESISTLFELNPSRSDLSWSVEGKRNLKEYHQEMETAATRIQQSWRERVEKKGTSSNAISV